MSDRERWFPKDNQNKTGKGIKEELEDIGEEISLDKTVVTVVAPTAVVTKRGESVEAALVIIHGKELGKKYKLGDSTVIGRSVKCDVQIEEDSVSRNHCLIKRTGRSYVIRDLGSTNGTRVNDSLIDEAVLRDGDLIQVGRTILKFISSVNIESSYHEEIYRLMTTDGLTQVYNKRYFLEQLEKEISRAVRYGRDLSLIMFDIDHFKRINDTYGHLAGDAILKQLAQLVKAKIRREDIIGRYGGEEFGIILPEINKLNAILTAEKIRKLVEVTTFMFEEVLIPVTVSLGVASLEDEPLSPEELIKRADEKLYEAKRTGRNRVCG